VKATTASKRPVASTIAMAALAAFAVLGVFSARGANAAKAGADLSGVWRKSRKAPDRTRKYTVFELALAFTVDEPVMTPWAEARFKANKPSFGARAVPYADSNDPDARCFPPGVPRIYLERGEPMEILQLPGKVVMVFEYDHFIRQIYTDGRQHPKEMVPTWMGDSIGRWEGDTLVVDTVGFNDKTWLDMVGHPHSEGLQVAERIRRVGHDQLAIDLTIDDPKAYAKPWGGHMIFDRKVDWSLGEMICEDNITFDDFQKKQRPAN
jgi:hypothetical protein